MKINKFTIKHPENELWFRGDDYVFNSFVEVNKKENDNNQEPPNNSLPPQSNRNQTSQLETWQVVLIIGIILLVLSLIIAWYLARISKIFTRGLTNMKLF